MTRRDVILAAFVRSDYDDLKARAISFEVPWDVFVRGLFGCDPKGETTAENCRAHHAHIDRGAYEKAREAAKKLFDLVDKRQ